MQSATVQRHIRRAHTWRLLLVLLAVSPGVALLVLYPGRLGRIGAAVWIVLVCLRGTDSDTPRMNRCLLTLAAAALAAGVLLLLG